MAFDGLTGLFLGAELRPGNVYTSNNAEVFLADIISQHKQHSCDMFLTVRGDSGFAKPEIYELCEQEKVKYIIRLKVNARLKNMAQQKVLYGPDTDFTHKLKLRLVQFGLRLLLRWQKVEERLQLFGNWKQML